jgi:hypothetical protein
MPAASSAERVVDVPGHIRAGMMLAGFLPLLHVAAAVTPAVLGARRGDPRLMALAPAVLYLLPPLLVRLITLGRPLPQGRVELASGAFLRWWTMSQCQAVFARLPFLEELLRLVPSLYSAWLRLFGARVGALVYWAPGVSILDRSLIAVGDRVAVGAGARLASHAIAPVEGRGALVLGRIVIADDALVGGYATLLPGCEIAAGEVAPALRAVHAFTRMAGGRRVRLPVPGVTDRDAVGT